MDYTGELAPRLAGFPHFSPLINSDHAEIRAEYGGVKLASLNISNRYMHGWFSFRGWYYGKTHLFVPENGSSPQALDWLANKHLLQIKNIKHALVSEHVDVYCIQEAYFDFIQELQEALQGTNWGITYPPASVTGAPDPLDANTVIPMRQRRNVNIILWNRDRVTVSDTGYYNVEYEEPTLMVCGGTNFTHIKQVKLAVPWITVAAVGGGPTFRCYSVHITGNRQQYPEKGIALMLEQLSSAPTAAVALGDWNTATTNINTCSLAHDMLDVSVAVPLYPTHINTANQVCTYDNLVYKSTSDILPPIMCSERNLPEDSYLLVQALQSLL